LINPFKEMIFEKTLLAALLITSLPIYPQEGELKFFKTEIRDDKYNAGAPVFSPIALPVYTPEMGYFIAGGGLLSFKTKKNNDYLTHSILPIMVGIDKNRNFYLSSNINTYWLDDRLLLFIDGYYQNRTDNYWGIGNSNAKTVNKSDSTTQYKNKGIRFNPSLSFKLIKHLYLGLKADVNKTTATNLSDLMLEDQAILKYGRIVKNTGLGILICYDSRDVPTNPYKGIYLNIDELFYSKSLSGDYNYKIFGIDYRHYLPVIRNGSIIALQLNSKLGFGNIPWTEVQKLGGENGFRGYYYGQYRDKSSIITQLEYRHTLSFDNGKTLSRHGFIFWIGSGTVFPGINYIDELLFSTGAGYRFEVQPRKNIRLDIGFGTENVGMYIGFNETF
jgi:hypothetical protein